MTKLSLLILLFCLSIVLGLASSLLKLSAASSLSEFLGMLNIFVRVAFSLMVVIEVINSQRLTISEKIMWTVCIVPIYYVTGVLYLVFGSSRVIKEYKMLSL